MTRHSFRIESAAPGTWQQSGSWYSARWTARRAAAFGQAFEAILAALEDPGEQGEQ